MYNLLEKEKQVCENKHGPFYRIASISKRGYCWLCLPIKCVDKSTLEDQ